ncbi:hypothetical protein GCM10009741_23310 [Kribbella lupini]|uniref:Uncharacterized protein n=1 Tax=Kribbella lupini TaxID=291602 RepID=A0ABP4LDP6_9ACTN
MPPPNPATVDETDVDEVANGPREASMLELLGAGPRSYGLSAAWLGGAATATAPTRAAVSVTVGRTLRNLT